MPESELSDLIEAAEAAVRTEQPVTALAGLMAGVAGHPDTALSYLPGAGQDEHLLYSSPTLTLLRVEAPPGMCYPPHEHRMSAVIAVLAGEECNTYYRENADGLVAQGERRSVTGEIVTMSTSVIHAVSNLGEQRAVGLHAYTGDLFGVQRTLWDPQTGQRYRYTDERYFAMARNLFCGSANDTRESSVAEVTETVGQVKS